MGWAPSYAAAAELRAFRRITSTADDAMLGLALAASSRAVDRASNRQFGLVDAPVARYYTARWDRELCRWQARIDDLMSTVGLVVAVDTAGDGTYAGTIATSACVFAPRNAEADGRPWEWVAFRETSATQPTGAEDELRITAPWGWSSIPDPVKQATLLQASRLLGRRDSPFGIAGSPDQGSELRLLAKLDPDVAVNVASFRRFWGAV